MGLPHVLVRFYTNPDGAAARRTTLVVLGLVGLFYLLPTLYGVLGRVYAPAAAADRRHRRGGAGAARRRRSAAALAGQLLGALVAAGAFAAFLSSASGLLTSVAGVLSTDVLGRRLGARLPDRRGRRRRGAARPRAAGRPSLDVSLVVGLAFAVAASSFCPLLVLGIWWRGLTDVGAAAGVLVGGGGAVGGGAAHRARAAPATAGRDRCSATRPRGRCRWRSP